jgi:hypothetical protein
MAIREDVRPRAPRGTKNVTQAFFAALDGIAEGQQAAVATAAVAGIRGELKDRRLRTKEAAGRAKAKAPAKTKRPAKAKAAATRATPAAARKQATATKAPARRKVPAIKAKAKRPARTVSPPERTPA